MTRRKPSKHQTDSTCNVETQATGQEGNIKSKSYAAQIAQKDFNRALRLKGSELARAGLGVEPRDNLLSDGAPKKVTNALEDSIVCFFHDREFICPCKSASADFS